MIINTIIACAIVISIISLLTESKISSLMKDNLKLKNEIKEKNNHLINLLEAGNEVIEDYMVLLHILKEKDVNVDEEFERKKQELYPKDNTDINTYLKTLNKNKK